MNAHFLIVAALVAVAAARPQEYHDDVFHFSSKVNHENLGRSSVVSQSVPVLAKSLQPVQSVVVKSVPQYQQQSLLVKSAPVYSQVHHLVHEQQPSVLFRSLEQEIPSVHAVHHAHHVHQPVYSQVDAVSQVAPVVARSSIVPQYNQYSHSAYGVAEPKFRILKQVQEFDPVGFYRANYETENGIVSVEQGSVKDVQAKEGPVAAKEGSYAYTGPDGVQYTVNWVADEFGYRAAGAHLPVAPEVPAEIQRSLELIAAQPQKYDQDGNLVARL